jgi:hypothetical protein
VKSYRKEKNLNGNGGNILRLMSPMFLEGIIAT